MRDGSRQPLWCAGCVPQQTMRQVLHAGTASYFDTLLFCTSPQALAVIMVGKQPTLYARYRWARLANAWLHPWALYLARLQPRLHGIPRLHDSHLPPHCPLCRAPIYAVVRPLGYLSPSVRNTRHAAAQLLAQPASPGLWGMLTDLKRLMLASRVTGTGKKRFCGTLHLLQPAHCPVDGAVACTAADPCIASRGLTLPPLSSQCIKCVPLSLQP